MLHVGIYPMQSYRKDTHATTCGSHQPLGGMGKLLSAVIFRKRDKKFWEDMEKCRCLKCGDQIVLSNYVNLT